MPSKGKRTTREWKADLGFNPDNAQDERMYKKLRDDAKHKLWSLGIQNKTSAGRDSWEIVVDFVKAHAQFRGRSSLSVPGTARAKATEEAINEFLIDVCKKVAESNRKTQRVLGEVQGDSDKVLQVTEALLETPDPDASTLPELRRKAVHLVMVDPDAVGPVGSATAYSWNYLRPAGPGYEISMATLGEPTLGEVVTAFKDIIPVGRKLRIVRGATTTPPARGPPPPFQEFITDDHVRAYLLLTTSVPIILQGILHRQPPPAQATAGRTGVSKGSVTASMPVLIPQTPPHKFRPYYAFEPEVYEDVISDVDEQHVTLRGFPKKDESFEMRLQRYRDRIKRDRHTMSILKAKHKEKFPDAIHSDDENYGWKTIKKIKDPKDRIAKRRHAKRKAIRTRVRKGNQAIRDDPNLYPASPGSTGSWESDNESLE